VLEPEVIVSVTGQMVVVSKVVTVVADSAGVRVITTELGELVERVGVTVMVEMELYVET
jgi:hypothetical protein